MAEDAPRLHDGFGDELAEDVVGGLAGGGGGEVDEVPGGAFEQVHRLDGLVGGHREPPRARAVVAEPGRELVPGNGARAVGRDFEEHRGADGLSVLVDGFDAHLRGPAAGVDESKTACVPGARAGAEHRDAVLRVGNRDEVVHARKESVVALDVGQDLELESRAKAKPPVPGAGAEALGEPLVRVAVLEVARGEVHGLVRADVEGEGGGRGAVIVEGFDVHGARLAGAVDDADEPLDAVSQPACRSGKERDLVREASPSNAGFAGEADRLTRCPMGLETRLITSSGRGEVTTSRHLPCPAPSAPASPGAPDSSSCALRVRAAPGDSSRRTVPGAEAPVSSMASTRTSAGCDPGLTSRRRLAWVTSCPGLNKATW